MVGEIGWPAASVPPWQLAPADDDAATIDHGDLAGTVGKQIRAAGDQAEVRDAQPSGIERPQRGAVRPHGRGHAATSRASMSSTARQPCAGPGSTWPGRGRCRWQA